MLSEEGAIFREMRLQKDRFSCAALAALNAIEAMTGEILPLAPFKKAVGADAKDGGSDIALIAALVGAGYGVKEIAAGFTAASRRLRGHLRKGGAAVLITENGSHCETAIGLIGKRVLIFDPQDNGTVSLSPQDLQDRWTPCDDGARYALLVSQ